MEDKKIITEDENLKLKLENEKLKSESEKLKKTVKKRHEGQKKYYNKNKDKISIANTIASNMKNYNLDKIEAEIVYDLNTILTNMRDEQKYKLGDKVYDKIIKIKNYFIDKKYYKDEEKKEEVIKK